MSDRITINGIDIQQPTKFDPNWETTYSADTNRVITGSLYAKPLFTVESFSVEWTGLTAEEASKILKEIVSTPSKPNFQFHYFSWYYGEWRTGTFYVGKGSLNCNVIRDNHKTWKSISCNIIGVEPL